ncbi:MAG: hypothetical protein K940chlam5_00863 [Candidatus Anoxychlamydiales bacterium]|nr:hypothetical protein [Candidatus Anoxychlamydiales bacterium]
MKVKNLLKLVSQAANIKDSFKDYAIGFHGYGFVFKTYNSDKYTTNIGSSKLCSIGAYRHLCKRFLDLDKLKRINVDELLSYGKKYDLLVVGAIKALFPSLELGTDEVLFDIWVFVKTPEDKFFPITFYYNSSGLSIGAWNPNIIMSNFDTMLGNKIFPNKFLSLVNFSPSNFSEGELDLFVEAFLCAISKVPIADFSINYSYGSERFCVGIKLGKPYIIKEQEKQLSRTWSYSILGNDLAMHFYHEYILIINKNLTPVEREMREASKDRREIDKIFIARNYNQLFRFAQNQKSRLAFIILGWYIISHAGALPENLKQVILKYSDWSYEEFQLKSKKDRKERKYFLNDFREKLQNYDGSEKVFVPFFTVSDIINAVEARGEDRTNIWRQNIDYSICE